ncbi:MAG: hypothetical protein Ct9H300mP17_13000 [Candidatus Nitrosopelagicus sp.]|nr:MAG: hypothetical protein Ct9H300mP17_13000 [Candidatus Nitrosopelagicus sp.]
MGDYRPGIDALHKNGIRSPLLEVKFTKENVRKIAKNVGLSIYDKPSNSCLASRIPWGQRVTAEKLARIELSEKIIKQKIGVQQVRVRDINGLARIEVELDKLIYWMIKNFKKEIFSKLKMIGFSEVEINPNGYVSGSLNVILENFKIFGIMLNLDFADTAIIETIATAKTIMAIVPNSGTTCVPTISILVSPSF